MFGRSPTCGPGHAQLGLPAHLPERSRLGRPADMYTASWRASAAATQTWRCSQLRTEGAGPGSGSLVRDLATTRSKMHEIFKMRNKIGGNESYQISEIDSRPPFCGMFRLLTPIPGAPPLEPAGYFCVKFLNQPQVWSREKWDGAPLTTSCFFCLSVSFSLLFHFKLFYFFLGDHILRCYRLRQSHVITPTCGHIPISKFCIHPCSAPRFQKSRIGHCMVDCIITSSINNAFSCV